MIRPSFTSLFHSPLTQNESALHCNRDGTEISPTFSSEPNLYSAALRAYSARVLARTTSLPGTTCCSSGACHEKNHRGLATSLRLLRNNSTGYSGLATDAATARKTRQAD